MQRGFFAADYRGEEPRVFVDYYEVLQISPNADDETVHRVYRIQAQRFCDQFMLGAALAGITAGPRSGEHDDDRNRRQKPQARARTPCLKDPIRRRGHVEAVG